MFIDVIYSIAYVDIYIMSLYCGNTYMCMCGWFGDSEGCVSEVQSSRVCKLIESLGNLGNSA